MPKRLNSPHIWQPAQPVETNARLVLPAMAREYFAHGRKIVNAATPAAHLHPFRLDTKRFRYTLEIFRDLYGPPMEEKLSLLKPLQDALGDVNDCVATRHEFSAGKAFRKFLKARASKKAAQFYQAWQVTFDAAGQEESWVEFLAAVPLPAKRAPARRSRQPKAAVNGHDLSGHEPWSG